MTRVLDRKAMALVRIERLTARIRQAEDMRRTSQLTPAWVRQLASDRQALKRWKQRLLDIETGKA